MVSKGLGSSEKKISFNLFIGVAALAVVLLIALVFVYADSSAKSVVASSVASSSAQSGVSTASELSSLQSQVQSLASEKTSLEDQLITARKQAASLQEGSDALKNANLSSFIQAQRQGVSAQVFSDGKQALLQLLKSPGVSQDKKDLLLDASNSFDDSSTLLANLSIEGDYLRKQFESWSDRACNFWIGSGNTTATIGSGFCLQVIRNVLGTKSGWKYVNSTKATIDSVGKSNSMLVEALSG